MVLALAAAADRVATTTLEVDAGRVEEGQDELAEEVTALGEEALLDDVLDAAGGERRAAILLVRGSSSPSQAIAR